MANSVFSSNNSLILFLEYATLPSYKLANSFISVLSIYDLFLNKYIHELTAPKFLLPKAKNISAESSKIAKIRITIKASISLYSVS